MNQTQTFPEALHFEDNGLLGFEDLSNYKLYPHAEAEPFYVLEADETAFLLMEPGYFIEDYSFELDDESLEELGITQAEDVGVLVLIRIPDNAAQMTANLLGPVVFHRQTGKAKQLVLSSEHYLAQHPVFAEEVDHAGTDPQA